jgi:hypothetical protein
MKLQIKRHLKTNIIFNHVAIAGLKEGNGGHFDNVFTII